MLGGASYKQYIKSDQELLHLWKCGYLCYTVASSPRNAISIKEQETALCSLEENRVCIDLGSLLQKYNHTIVNGSNFANVIQDKSFYSTKKHTKVL